MNPLLRRLGSLRRQVLFLEGSRGLCALLALVAGAFVVVGALDWQAHLPSLVRATALLAILAGAGVIAYRMLLMPLAAPRDDLALALRIEEQYPELNDALASTVQFLQQDADGTAAGSAGMRARAIQQTGALADQLDFGRIIDRRGVLILAGVALVVAGVAGFLAYRLPETARTAALRLAVPFGWHPWTRVEFPETPHRVAVGQPFVLRGEVAGIVPAQAKVEIESSSRTDRVVPIKLDADTGTGSLIVPLDMTQHRGKFKFRVLANDGSYPPRPNRWHEVEVLPPPELANLNNGLPSPQITLHIPAYTDRPSPQPLAPGTLHLALLAGTEVELRAAANRPLAEAWVEYRPESELVWKGAMASVVGQTGFLPLAGSLTAGLTVWGQQPAAFDADRSLFTVRFQPWVTGSYLLHLQDADGLVKRYAANLIVSPDPVPVVKLHKPETSVTVLPDAEVSFKFQVEDEAFAVRSVFVEYRRKKDDGSIDAVPTRVVLYDGAAFGAALPRVLARTLPTPLVGPAPRLRPTLLTFDTRWALKNQFAEGDTLLVQVAADDYCDLYPAREPGRSHEIELRIVGKQELAKTVENKLAEVQQDLVRLQKMQKDALDLVREVQKNQKPTQKDVDQLLESEAGQKSVQERVGKTGEEGMRGELNKLLQLLKDNKMTDTEAKEKAGMLKGELDRLAKNELQQIEPNLTEARKEVAGAEKNKEALSKAEKLQTAAKNSLDELAAQMNPWATLQEIKAEARDLRNKQQEIQKQVEEVQTRKKDPLPGTEEQIRKDLAQAADEQKQLADRTEKLVRKMKEVQEKREQQNDKESAQRLADAGKTAEQTRLEQQMRNVAQQLKEKDAHEQKAIQQQARNVENLDKVVNSLEGKKDETAERLQKKQKKNLDAQDNVEKLTRKMKELEKKVADAKANPDAGERKRQLQELAEAHDKLKEEVEKNARELARLEEPRASNDLDQAAQELDKAAGKLRQGDDPGEEEQLAREKVQQAQQELEETEDELARERLAKIADRLKGIKERQEALVERSQDFQKRLLDKKSWTEGLLDSLQGDTASQKGVAEETKALAEKLKEAKIFENILQRAVKDMDRAAEAMDERHKEGKENLVDPLEAKPFEKEEAENEAKRHTETVKYQQAAGRRLDRLLDALKQEIAKKEEKKEGEEKKEPEQKEGQEQQGKMRAGDGIPPMAQIKALKAEQLDVYERTKEFGERHPDANALMPDQQRELAGLREDQERIHNLFQQMIAPADPKGDMP